MLLAGLTVKLLTPLSMLTVRDMLELRSDCSFVL
jgi:hypothetical protein